MRGVRGGESAGEYLRSTLEPGVVLLTTLALVWPSSAILIVKNLSGVLPGTDFPLLVPFGGHCIGLNGMPCYALERTLLGRLWGYHLAVCRDNASPPPCAPPAGGKRQEDPDDPFAVNRSLGSLIG